MAVKTLNLDSGESASVAYNIPYLITTVDNADVSTTYAATAEGTIEESDSWGISSDDEVLFFSDNILMEFADA